MCIAVQTAYATADYAADPGAHKPRLRPPFYGALTRWWRLQVEQSGELWMFVELCIAVLGNVIN